MRDHLNLGPVPCEESCVPVGAENYMKKSKQETWAFVRQLQRQFPDTDFGVKTFPHEFGSYVEAVVWFDTDDPESVEKALKAERESPMHWDAEARAELQR